MKSPDSLNIDGQTFYFFREHFPFGDFPGYTNGQGRFRFWVDGRAMNGDELADWLDREYVQQSEAGIREAVGSRGLGNPEAKSYPGLRAMKE